MDPRDTVMAYLNQDVKIMEDAHIAKLSKVGPCMVNENNDQAQILKMIQSMIDKYDNEIQILQIHNNALECSIANASDLAWEDQGPVKLEFRRQYDHIHNKFVNMFEKQTKCVYENKQYMDQLKLQSELQSRRKINLLKEIALTKEKIDNLDGQEVINAQNKLAEVMKYTKKQQVILENLFREVETTTNKLHGIGDEASIENNHLKETLNNLDTVSYAEEEKTMAVLQNKADGLEGNIVQFRYQIRCDDQTSSKEYEVLKAQVDNDKLGLLQQSVDVCKQFNCPYELNNSVDTFIKTCEQIQAFAIDAHRVKLDEEEQLKLQLGTLQTKIACLHHITECEQTKTNNDIIQCKLQFNKRKELEKLLPEKEAQYNSKKDSLNALNVHLEKLNEASALALAQGVADEQEIMKNNSLQQERQNKWENIIKGKKTMAIAELQIMNTKTERLEKLIQHAEISRDKMSAKLRAEASSTTLENKKKVTFNEVIAVKDITAEDTMSDMTHNTPNK